MNIRKLSWVLGGACLVAGGGFGATACSSSAGPGSAGSGLVADSGGSNADGGGGDEPDAGDGTNCGKVPKLHPGDGGSVYCPFGPDASPIDCPTGSTICCIGGEIAHGDYAVSQCGTPGEICPNPLPDAGMYPARPVECEEAVDCVPGDAGPIVCCATGGKPAMDTACGYYRESPGLTATTCTAAAACPAGQFQVCATDAECGSGHSCVPFKALGIQLGFCQ